MEVGTEPSYTDMAAAGSVCPMCTVIVAPTHCQYRTWRASVGSSVDELKIRTAVITCGGTPAGRTATADCSCAPLSTS
ncbi:MAG: hypothetical protein QOJ37_112, partial [Pseudonocardiales bacterium]|nr:hypothetical protein [Pseudonocardiales bacterium]